MIFKFGYKTVEDWLDVESVEDCEEMATMDCHDDDECLSGWFSCLEEVFVNIERVKLFEEEIDFKGFDFSGRSIAGVCRKGKKKVKVGLDSIKFPNLTKVQKLWLEEWLKWQK